MDEQSLQDFIEEHTGDAHLRVKDDLGNGFVRLRAAEAQRRQAKQDIRCFEDVVIEMLRNARDAHAHAIFVATWTEGPARHLTMIDDGSGIPEALHETVFEPFVTSKLDTFHADRWGVHGRGMALYSIRENVRNAHVVASGLDLGSVFSVESDSTSLTEKRDQSTIPRIVRKDDGTTVMRGPHNIARTVMEFAIEERGRCAVYLGSPAEIASTLYHLSLEATVRLAALLDPDIETAPFYQRLGFATDATELADQACALALPISSRSAHRIIKGEIEPLRTHLELLVAEDESVRGTKRQSALRAKPKKTGAHIAKTDLDEFAGRTLEAYEPLAEAYYLDPDVDPRIQVRDGEIVIRIPLAPRE